MNYLNKTFPLIVISDFVEKFSFVLEDAVQGFQWNNVQATVHPLVIYYTKENIDKLEHINLVEISECMTNDKGADKFWQLMIDYLKHNFCTAQQMGQHHNIKTNQTFSTFASINQTST